MNLDPRLLKWARLAWKKLTAATSAGYGGAVVSIALAWQISAIVSGVFLSGWSLDQAMPALWIMLALIFFRAILNWISESVGVAAAVLVKSRLRTELFKQIFLLGPSYTQAQKSGELVTTVLNGLDGLDMWYSHYLPQIFLAACVPLTILAVVFPLDALSGLVFLLTGPLIPLFMILIGRTAADATRKQVTALGRISAFFLDSLQGLATLKLLNRSRARVEAIAKASEQYRKTTMEVLRLTFLSAFSLELAATISTAVVAVQLGLRLLVNGIEFHPAFFILLLAPEFYLPLRLLGQYFHAGAAATAAAERISAVLDYPFPTSGLEPAGSLGPDDRGSLTQVQLAGISYRYPTRDVPALDGINLTLRSGEVTAVVGVSGAGKSTLGYLLLGFITPLSGEIRINGQALRTLNSENWRRRVAWVPQRSHLFNATLLDNIRLGKPEASQEEVENAARLAGLHDWITGLPQAYHTMVGEGGARLSGGQVQRVALARAFLRDASVLILDEPAAQLDPQLETDLAETTRRLCQGRITLLIAHRLGTVRSADQVVVLERGRIVEQGSPADLLGRLGVFQKLISSFEGHRL